LTIIQRDSLRGKLSTVKGASKKICKSRSKANWLINYPDKTIRFSNKNLSDNTFKPIEITFVDGIPYTIISINGIQQKVCIDFGSSSEFSIPEDSKLAKELLNTYKFNDHQRDLYTTRLEGIKISLKRWLLSLR
jgi:hypothetical protein